MVALSELHSRLEHLVSYSSQLIFVSGETIGQQQSLLEAFLGQQSELTEIAYLTATTKLTTANYRQELMRQLLGDTSGAFSRPLNELLAPLNQHEGPVLICICQAEKMPKQLLQELWELVLQSRFARNKQHLNVLLFGEPQWAEQAKAWIPANNKDKPLLLSNESVSSELISQDSTTVQALITHKRQQFEQRLKARHQSNQPANSMLQKWWLKLLFIGVFLICFAGILIWQYIDIALEKLQDITAFLGPPVAVQSVITEVESNTVDDQPITVSEHGTTELTVAPPEVNPVLTTKPQAHESSQALVTDWQTAIEKIETQQSQAKDQQQPPKIAEAETISDAQPTDMLEPEASLEDPTVVTGYAERVIDYAVEDIVSEEQLNTEITPPNVKLPPAGNYKFNEPELRALNSDQFVLQLAAMSNEMILNQYLLENQLSEFTWVYKTQRFGGNWYVVLYKQSFSSLIQARQATSELPKTILTDEPFAKALSAVQQEIIIE